MTKHLRWEGQEATWCDGETEEDIIVGSQSECDCENCMSVWQAQMEYQDRYEFGYTV